MSCRRLRQQRLDSKDVHGPYFVKNLTVPSRHSKAVGAGGGGTMAPPDVDRSVYPISTEGADYGNHINNGPSGLSDLPRPCTVKAAR